MKLRTLRRALRLRVDLRATLPVTLIAALVSCASTSDPATGELEVDLRHRDPRVRIDAAIRAEQEDRFDLFQHLLANLEHSDVTVRMVNGTALKRLTGVDVGYRAHETPGERREAIERWKAWWRDRHGGGGGGSGERPWAHPSTDTAHRHPQREASDETVISGG